MTDRTTPAAEAEAAEIVAAVEAPARTTAELLNKLAMLACLAEDSDLPATWLAQAAADARRLLNSPPATVAA